MMGRVLSVLLLALLSVGSWYTDSKETIKKIQLLPTQQTALDFNSCHYDAIGKTYTLNLCASYERNAVHRNWSFVLHIDHFNKHSKDQNVSVSSCKER